MWHFYHQRHLSSFSPCHILDNETDRRTNSWTSAFPDKILTNTLSPFIFTTLIFSWRVSFLSFRATSAFLSSPFPLSSDKKKCKFPWNCWAFWLFYGQRIFSSNAKDSHLYFSYERQSVFNTTISHIKGSNTHGLPFPLKSWHKITLT